VKRIMKNVFLGISAIVSIFIVSIIVGHAPRGVVQFVLYAFPGGILMFFIFDPLLKAFSGRTEDETEIPASPTVKSVKLTEQDDSARGISVSLVALRWDSDPLNKQELRDRAAKAVQLVDSQFDKDVMDVKILVVDEDQQYVQLSVRADFRDKAEEDEMRKALKKEFVK
jgi:hypothetical protein